ncbi:class I SAM-dependent methyltransferase [Micromonospora chokoriensis]
MDKRSAALDDHEDEEYVRSVSAVPYCKNIGISNLLTEFGGHPGPVVLDVMGGAGQIALAARRYGLTPAAIEIITADHDTRHVEQANRRHLPAIALDITDLSIVAPESIDHVLMAHHVHHLSPSERLRAVDEIVRCLRSDGTLVIYEGPDTSTTAHLSDTVVDELSGVPHRFRHPGREELVSLADHPRLTGQETTSVDSPLVFLADDARQARELANQYFIAHYSLQPGTTWEQLSSQLHLAYTRARVADGLHVGALPDGILTRLFPSPADRHPYLGQACVVVRREGLIVKARKR